MTQQPTTLRRTDRQRPRPSGRGAAMLVALLATAGVAAGTVTLATARHGGGGAVPDGTATTVGQQVGGLRADPTPAGIAALETLGTRPSDRAMHDATPAGGHRTDRIGTKGTDRAATSGTASGAASPATAAVAAGPATTPGTAAPDPSQDGPDGTADGLGGRRRERGDGIGATNPAGPAATEAQRKPAATPDPTATPEPAATPGAEAGAADPVTTPPASAASTMPNAVAPPAAPSPGPADIGADLFAPATVPTAVEGADEARARALLDASRAAAGVGALHDDAGLRQAAQAWADHLAATGTFQHQPLGPLLGRFTTAAENLALAADVDAAHAALLGSPGHLANLLDARFRVVGIGVAHTADGGVIVCQLFAA